MAHYQTCVIFQTASTQFLPGLHTQLYWHEPHAHTCQCLFWAFVSAVCFNQTAGFWISPAVEDMCYISIWVRFDCALETSTFECWHGKIPAGSELWCTSGLTPADTVLSVVTKLQQETRVAELQEWLIKFIMWWWLMILFY